MRKQVQVEINDLFDLQPSLKERIYNQIKTDKRTTISITAKKCKCSIYAAKANLEKLTTDGMINNLGTHLIKNRNCIVYEVK